MQPLLCFILTLFLLTSLAKTLDKALPKGDPETKMALFSGIVASSVENPQIVESNPLYHDMFEFGMKKLLEKGQTSEKVQFDEKPAYKMISVRTLSGPGLRVAFTANMTDKNGSEHEAVFTVAYQSWKGLMVLEEGSVNESIKEKSEE